MSVKTYSVKGVSLVILLVVSLARVPKPKIARQLVAKFGELTMNLFGPSLAWLDVHDFRACLGE
jgi:hypothetical protein